jgi:uncharacterized damage-inducible protein DinB
MKTYFINLFNYDRYANERILEAIAACNEPDKPVQLMAHLLAAQTVWLTRCLGMPHPDLDLWPPLGDKRFIFPAMIARNHEAWNSFLENLPETGFEKTINYKSTRGEPFKSSLSDIITQVINHGTHHRAQIGQLLKFTGFENLPVTDYIFYTRQLKQ